MRALLATEPPMGASAIRRALIAIQHVLDSEPHVGLPTDRLRVRRLALVPDLYVVWTASIPMPSWVSLFGMPPAGPMFP